MLKSTCLLLVILAASFEVVAVFTKIVCEFNKDYINNTTCVLKPIAKKVKLIQFGFNVYRPIDDLMVNIENLVKNSVNIYLPGFFNLTRDMCSVMHTGSLENQFIETFLHHVEPGYKAMIMSYFKDCPYKGSIYFERKDNYTNIRRKASDIAMELMTKVQVFSDVDKRMYFKLTLYYGPNN